MVCASTPSPRCCTSTTRARTGEWIPNKYGGRENLEAVAFLQQLNTLTHADAPGTITVAEESTAWPGVSRPVHLGGLGFTYKWNMGWMHDTLKYTRRDPLYRKWAQNEITFSMLYAYTRELHPAVLARRGRPRQAIDAGQDAGRLVAEGREPARALRASCTRTPARSCSSWATSSASGASGTTRAASTGICWAAAHQGLQRSCATLNRLYPAEPALFERDYDLQGFQWIDGSDHENNVIAFLRRGASAQEEIVAVFNWTPVLREGYRIGAPVAGTWQVLLNTDATGFGGSGTGPTGAIETEAIRAHGMEQSFTVSLPPPGRAGPQAAA